MPRKLTPPATTVEDVLGRRGRLVVPFPLFVRLLRTQARVVEVWIEKGLPLADDPGGGRARAFDLLEVLPWVKRFLTRVEEERLSPNDKLAIARTEQAERQSERIKLELDVRRGELAPTELLERAYRHLVVFLRGRALSWARKLAVAIDPKDPQRVERILDAEIRRVLDEMARDEGDLLEAELHEHRKRQRRALPRLGGKGRKPKGDEDAAAVG